MSVFKVAKNVPVPSDLTLNRKFYPWTELEPGDSFFVRGAKVTNMSAKAAWAGRQYHKQYVCRSVKGGVRVWCLGYRDPETPRKNSEWNKRQAAAAARKTGQHRVSAYFEPVTAVWIVTSWTIPGLVVEAATLEEAGRKCDLVIPALLAEAAICDGSPKGEDPKGLHAEHDSAVAEGEAP